MYLFFEIPPDSFVRYFWQDGVKDSCERKRTAKHWLENEALTVQKAHFLETVKNGRFQRLNGKRLDAAYVVFPDTFMRETDRDHCRGYKKDHEEDLW